MPVIKWKPLRELEEVFEELPFRMKTWDLAVDMWEDNTAVIVEMHIPGIAPDNIDVE